MTQPSAASWQTHDATIAPERYGEWGERQDHMWRPTQPLILRQQRIVDQVGTPIPATAAHNVLLPLT